MTFEEIATFVKDHREVFMAVEIRDHYGNLLQARHPDLAAGRRQDYMRGFEAGYLLLMCSFLASDPGMSMTRLKTIVSLNS